MRSLVLLSPTSQPSTPPPPELFEAIMQLGAEATAAGVLLDQSGLQPAEGALVALRQGAIHVTDGPFAESKEVVSYAVYETRDRAEVIEWSERFLRLHRDLWPGYEGEARVLPLFVPPPGAGPS